MVWVYFVDTLVLPYLLYFSGQGYWDMWCVVWGGMGFLSAG